MDWGKQLQSTALQHNALNPHQSFNLTNGMQQPQQFDTGIAKDMKDTSNKMRPALNKNYFVEEMVPGCSNTNFENSQRNQQQYTSSNSTWQQQNPSDVFQRFCDDVLDNANNLVELNKKKDIKDIPKELDKSADAEDHHQCKVCGMFLLSADILALHMKLHASLDVGETSKCEKKQSGKNSKSSTDPNSCDKKHDCTICGRNLSSKIALKGHMKLHTGTDLYRCDECDKTFTEKRSCDRHIQFVHRGKKPFQCIECGKLFDRKSSLRAHLDVHAGSRQRLMKLEDGDAFIVRRGITAGEKPYQCLKCNKTFKFKSGVDRHLLSHTSDRPFKCHVCAKSFKTKNFVKNHMKIHTGEKPYSCRVCKKTFLRPGNLRHHMTSHDARPYQCSICNKAFLTKRYLTRHLTVHSGGRPFKCEQCGQCFKLKGTLMQHMKMHTKDVAFVCVECGKMFEKKLYLSRHMKIHDNLFICPKNNKDLETELSHKCMMCGLSFLSEESVRMHCLLLHRKLPF